LLLRMTLREARPQPRRPTHSTRVAVYVGYNARPHRVREYISRKQLGHRIGKQRQIGHSAAEHDDVRIKNVDQPGKCASETIVISRESLLRARFPLGGSDDDRPAGHCHARLIGEIPLERRPGKKRFDAAAFPAVAR